jgi:hypothetical protein
MGCILTESVLIRNIESGNDKLLGSTEEFVVEGGGSMQGQKSPSEAAILTRK